MRRRNGNIYSAAVFFMVLAACDATNLLTYLLRETMPTQYKNLKQNYYYTSIYAWFLLPLFFMSTAAGTWIIAGMTLSRFITVTYPTKVKFLCTPRKCWSVILLILAFAIAISLPQFFVYTVVEKADGQWQLNHTEYGSSIESRNYEFWVHCMVLVFIPWFTIASLNILIILRMYQQIKRFQRVAKGRLKVAFNIMTISQRYSATLL